MFPCLWHKGQAPSYSSLLVGQCCAVELSTVRSGLCLSAQYGSHWLQVAFEHLKSGTGTKKQNFECYLILIHFNLNSHMWLLVFILDKTRVRVLHVPQKASTIAKWIFSPLVFMPLN